MHSIRILLQKPSNNCKEILCDHVSWQDGICYEEDIAFITPESILGARTFGLCINTIVLHGFMGIYTESKTYRNISLKIHGVVSSSKLLRDWFHTNSIFSIYLKLFYLFDWVKFSGTFKGSISLQNTDYTKLSLICVDLFTCNTTRYSFLCVCLVHFKDIKQHQKWAKSLGEVKWFMIQ